jgi:hypothetical protein
VRGCARWPITSTVIPSERSESRDLHLTTGVPNDGARMTRI